MGNCLVIKLKEVVQNDNLLPLGMGVIEVNKGSDTSNCRIVCTTSSVLQIHGSGTITDVRGVSSSTSIEIFAGEAFTLSAGTYKVYYDKYNVVPIFDNSAVGIKFYTDDLAYSQFTGLSNLFGTRSLKGDVNWLRKFTSLNRLSINHAYVYGDIANLPGTALAYLTASNNSELTGDISSLSKYPNFTEMAIAGTKIYGSLEGLVQAYRIAGKTVSTGNGIEIAPNKFGDTLLSLVTFNGNVLNNTSASYLTWTASSITFNGTTISA